MRVILIAGPTASGKSSAAIGVAEQCNGVIVNADSMQVYKELDVLTSRPPRTDEERVEHCLYGYIPGAEACSVARWLNDVQATLGDIAARGKTPVVVGGTGLYFKAMEFGLSPVPEIDAAVRDNVRRALKEQGAASLHNRLSQHDEAAAKRLKENDGQRIARALEVVLSTGKPLQWWQQKAAGEAVLANWELTRIALCPPRAQLYERINTRFEDMVDGGALEEVKNLLGLELDPSLPVMKAIGVRALAGYLRGDCSRRQAIDMASQETRNYAKRQMTWQRNQMVQWPVFENASDIVDKIFEGST